ncbi:MAG TPA: hypothetical protein VMT11_05510 [Myxococcaceae bacterium]|nr:hypothetical protein [Myxococcaceae bacterium]
MKPVLKLVVLGLALGLGLALAAPKSDSPTPHYFVVGTTSSGERVFLEDKDKGKRAGFVYVGFATAPVPTAGSASKAGATDGGSASSMALAAAGDRPCNGVWVGSECMVKVVPAAVVVCNPAICNPPGPPRWKGDPPFDELFMNLQVSVRPGEKLIGLQVGR